MAIGVNGAIGVTAQKLVVMGRRFAVESVMIRLHCMEEWIVKEISSKKVPVRSRIVLVRDLVQLPKQYNIFNECIYIQ